MMQALAVPTMLQPYVCACERAPSPGMRPHPRPVGLHHHKRKTRKTILSVVGGIRSGF